MSRVSDKRVTVTLVTLGPAGSCRERAAIGYMAVQGVEDFAIELIGEEIGEFDASWVVYGTGMRVAGEVIGTSSRGLFLSGLGRTSETRSAGPGLMS
jgi:hypothetical protein